jgi:myo-inositol catabolism protein IolH
VISSCVFGWEEDARGISERQRDKAVALIGKHFGNDSEAAVTSSKLKEREISS